MDKLDERMRLISSAILEQAEKESREIIQDANASRELEIKRYREQLIFSMYETIQSAVTDIKLEAVKDVAQYELQSHRALLGRRSDYTAAVFSAVRARLLEYAQTPEYKADLLRCAKKIRAAYPDLDHTCSALYLREADLPLKSELVSIFPGSGVLRDPSNQLGGFLLCNERAKIRIDETLESRLRDNKPWFLQHCAMKVTD